jgi:hypothetical protein
MNHDEMIKAARQSAYNRVRGALAPAMAAVRQISDSRSARTEALRRELPGRDRGPEAAWCTIECGEVEIDSDGDVRISDDLEPAQLDQAFADARQLCALIVDAVARDRARCEAYAAQFDRCAQ